MHFFDCEHDDEEQRDGNERRKRVKNAMTTGRTDYKYDALRY